LNVRLGLLVLTIVVTGLGASTAYLIPWALLPDAVDADPDKPAGLYTAWMVVAQKLGIDPAGLQASVEQMNRCAETGTDPDFRRGETAYQRNLGDPAWGGPNPNLGPLRTAPFYAVRLWPGDIGAATGFATDEHAQALDANGRPIAGLYAVGNDMQSVMGGVYPGPGITLGPGLVFAWLAARHALGVQAGDPPRGA
jgi:succinate dehydrogenase/fumarate reductase flavoprotein subunit